MSENWQITIFTTMTGLVGILGYTCIRCEALMANIKERLDKGDALFVTKDTLDLKISEHAAACEKNRREAAQWDGKDRRR